MSDVVIQVDGLGKHYRIGSQQERHRTLRESMTAAATAPVRAVRRRLQRQKSAEEEARSFWALRNVSFDVKRGEAIGIIGHNGAGKSTLLKLLSRITEPTEGSIRIKGRVASLLEVGTGFHQELSGRENIYLNGAILGMKRAEIDRKFDEIVEFAEVEKFIDTAVKHYSSGMYLRLAFGVAAHMEPEILVVDEVLAVGDAVFQKKCLGKMSDVASRGRTILFVSHNMGALSNLCPNCICLKSGQIIDAGPTPGVIAGYMSRISVDVPDDGYADLRNNHRVGVDRDKAELTDVQLYNREAVKTGSFLEGEPFAIMVGFTIKEPVSLVQMAAGVFVPEGGRELFIEASPEYHGDWKPGDYTVTLHVDPNYLRKGNYRLVLKLFVDGLRRDWLGDCLSLDIQPYRRPEDTALLGLKWISGRVLFRYDWSEMTASTVAVPPKMPGA